MYTYAWQYILWAPLYASYSNKGTKQHLKNVYASLALTMLSAAAGAVAFFILNVQVLYAWTMCTLICMYMCIIIHCICCTAIKGILNIGHNTIIYKGHFLMHQYSTFLIEIHEHVQKCMCVHTFSNCTRSPSLHVYVHIHDVVWCSVVWNVLINGELNMMWLHLIGWWGMMQ